MGGYGFLRFSLPMFPNASEMFAPLVFALSAIAIVYTSLVAFRQTAIKKLIAYSSVAHMGFVTMGIFSGNAIGVQGAVFQMLSHGVISGALFLIVGVVYDRMHTREIAFYGSLVNRMPGTRRCSCCSPWAMSACRAPRASWAKSDPDRNLPSLDLDSPGGDQRRHPPRRGRQLYAARRVIFGEMTNPKLAAITDLNNREIAIFTPLVIATLPFSTQPGLVLDATSASGQPPRRRLSWRRRRGRPMSIDRRLHLAMPKTILVGRRADPDDPRQPSPARKPAAWLPARRRRPDRRRRCRRYRRAGEPPSTAFISDAAASYAKIVIYVMSAIAIVLGNGWLKRLGHRQFEYPLLILLAAIGMGMMVSAGAIFIALYIDVELQSLALYVMAAFRRDDPKASEAGLDTFVHRARCRPACCSMEQKPAIYGFAGSTHFDAIAVAVAGHSGTGVLFGLVFVICGLAFKVSPRRSTCGRPTSMKARRPRPVVAFVTGAPKLAAMVLLPEFSPVSFPHSTGQWRQVIEVIGVILVFVSAFAELVQSNIKRLLFSSIANMGYVLIGLCAGNAEGAQAVIIFMTLYMFDVTGFFARLTALVEE